MKPKEYELKIIVELKDEDEDEYDEEIKSDGLEDEDYGEEQLDKLIA